MCKCVYYRTCWTCPHKRHPNGEEDTHTHTKLALLHILYIPFDALRVRLGYIFCIFKNGGGLENSVTLWNLLPNFASKSMTKRLTDAPVPFPPPVLSVLCIEFPMCAGGVTDGLHRMDECRCGGTGAFCCRDADCKIKRYHFSLVAL